MGGARGYLKYSCAYSAIHTVEEYFLSLRRQRKTQRIIKGNSRVVAVCSVFTHSVCCSVLIVLIGSSIITKKILNQKNKIFFKTATVHSKFLYMKYMAMV